MAEAGGINPPLAGNGLRILMVLPSLARAGMETVAGRLATDLVLRGHRVAIACIEALGPLAPDLVASGVAVELVPAPGLAANFRAPALVSWFTEHRPDVVHTHSGAWLKGARAALAANVPGRVHTVHGIFDREPWYSNMLKRRAAACTSAVVAVSETLREYLLHSTRLEPSVVRTIPNGVDTSVFWPEPRSPQLQTKLGLDRRVVVGCVARFEPVKNHDLLLRAFSVAYRACPALLLVLVGDGTLRSASESLARALGIEPAVRFVGAQTDTASWYRCFDVFALASRAEGTSMSLLEAMASGCATVATDVGGNRAVLGGDGEVGLLVPSGDTTALAHALMTLGQSQELRTRLGVAGRLRAMSSYGQDVMVDRYEALYYKVLTPRPLREQAITHDA